MDNCTYVVTAYRWGWLNNSWYLVYSGTDRAKSIAIAQSECSDRGGKYGCQVLECCDGPNGEMVSKAIAYFASMHGEEKPNRNCRIDLIEDIGHIAINAIEDGSCWVSDEEKPGFMKLVNVEVPQWLKDEHDRKAEFHEKMQEIYDKPFTGNEEQESQPCSSTS